MSCGCIELIAVLGLTLVGCSTDYHVRAADREGQAIMAEKSALVERFRKELLDPRDAGAREADKSSIEVPNPLSLEDAILIATRHNRDYKSRRERYFLDAIGLGLTRRNFLETVFSGSLGITGTDGRRRQLAETTTLSLSGTRLFPTGGRLTMSTSGSIGHNEDRTQDADVTGTISFSQPLLRGAGKKIAFEGLTQAERNLVYAARDFEVFRQTFAIQITQEYFDLVQRKTSVENVRRRAEANEFVLREARSLYRLQQGPQVDVLRAEQTAREARNALLDAQETYQRSLDGFKIRLGVPLSAEFDVGDAFPAPEPLEVAVDGAVTAALGNRLDLATERGRVEDAVRNVMIARNRLLPDLDLSASYSIFSAEANSFRDLAFDADTASVSLTLELPFDRKSERNSYRSALISLEQSRRGYTQRRDNVVLDVRESLRRLEQIRQQIENDKANIKTLERRIKRARLDNLAGVGSNRDVVEAVNDRSAALNSLNARYVSYHISRLNLLQQMGLLFVDKEGRIIR